MKRRAVAISAGVAGAAYGAAVIALSPWRQAYNGWRAIRSLGEGLEGAMDAIAEETNAEIAAQLEAAGWEIVDRMEETEWR